jgi:hypothetical protein
LDRYAYTVSPNPFATQTTLHTNHLLHNASLTVYNCLGQTVKEIKHISGHTFTLFRENVSSGLYFIRLMQDNKLLMEGPIVIAD